MMESPAYLIHALLILSPCFSGKLVRPASIVSENFAKEIVGKRSYINRLAHAFRFPQGKFFGVLVDQISELEHHVAALRRTPLRPFALESSASRNYSLIDIIRRSYLDTICNETLVMRIVNAESFARCGIDILDSR